MLKFLAFSVYATINAYLSYIICIGKTELLWSNFSGLATVNIAILTAFIVFFGMNQLKATKAQLEESKKVNIKSLSHASYSKYLQLALKHPSFAFPNPDSIRAEFEVFVQYRWFIANMLFYFEEILVVNDKDKNWSDAISRQIRIHTWYLANSSYKNQAWSPQLVEIISKEVERNPFRKKREASEQTRKDSINALYEKYLDLLSGIPQFYQIDGDVSYEGYDRIAHTLFLKKALFILGQMAELTLNETEWDSLVKTEVCILKSTYGKYKQSGLENNKLILKQHQGLLKI